MSSVSLTSGMKSSLLSLQRTQKLVDTTQEHLTTGKKVAHASDDPAAYYKAVTLSNRAEDLSSRLDGMSEAIQAIKAADNGIGAMRSVLSNMKAVVENALTTGEEEASTRAAMGKKFNDLLVQLESFAKDSAYGGVNLLNNDQQINVQLGQRYNESVFTVTGFHVAGVTDVESNGEVAALDRKDTPASWRLDANGKDKKQMDYDPSVLNTLPADHQVYTYDESTKTIVYTAASGATTAVPDVEAVEKVNGMVYYFTSGTTMVDYATEVGQYAFALNKVEDPNSIVGIKSYGTDATTASGHEINWASAESYKDDLSGLLSSIEEIDEVLKTRSKLFSFDESTVTLREEYTQEFINTLETGSDNLTLADLNEEAANLLALQTAQSLGVQAMSLANEQTQNVLRLLQ